MTLFEDLRALKGRAAGTHDDASLGEILSRLAETVGELQDILEPKTEALCTAITNRLRYKEGVTRDDILFLTDMSEKLLDPGRAVADRFDALLDSAMMFRQELLTSKSLALVVEAIAEKEPDLTEDHRYRFLEAVVEYDKQMKQKNAGQPYSWEDVADRLEELYGDLPSFASSSLRFFVANQGFLATRNALSEARTGEESEIFADKRDRFAAEAEKTLPDLRDTHAHEAIGYLRYNQARALLKEGRRIAAWDCYREAAAHRYYHFELLKRTGTATDGYATQVLKVAFDVDHLFPGKDTSQFPFNLDYEQELIDTYQISPEFSVRPKEERADAWRARYGQELPA